MDNIRRHKWILRIVVIIMASALIAVSILPFLNFV